MSDVMITNAEGRVGLTLVRSLGRRGLKVVVCGSHAKSPAMKSKYAYASYVYDASSTNKLSESLIDAIERYKPKAFLPVLDDCLSAVHCSPDKFNSLPPLASKEEFDRFNDKAELSKFAKQNKILVPETYIVSNISQVKANVSNLSFPMIIKPKTGVFSTEVHLVNNMKELRSAFKSIKSKKKSVYYDGSTAILQEYIPNTLSYFNVLLSNGILLAKQQTKIIKTYPGVCGSPVNSVSTSDQQLDKTGIYVLEKMKVKNGIYNIQFIYDNQREKYVLLEINPRIWGSIQSSIDSEVDFPYLMYLSAIGEEFKPVLKHPVGRKVKHFQMELRSCLQKRTLDDYRELLKLSGTKTEFDILDLKPNAYSLMNDIYNMIFDGTNN